MVVPVEAPQLTLVRKQMRGGMRTMGTKAGLGCLGSAACLR